MGFSLRGVRRWPWLSGALLLVLAFGMAAPLVRLQASHRFALFAGGVAVLLLLFGAAERLWQRRPLPRRHRVDRSRFRVVTGGKAKGKSNGHARDLPEDQGGDDKPRWVM